MGISLRRGCVLQNSSKGKEVKCIRSLNLVLTHGIGRFLNTSWNGSVVEISGKLNRGEVHGGSGTKEG